MINFRHLGVATYEGDGDNEVQEGGSHYPFKVSAQHTDETDPEQVCPAEQQKKHHECQHLRHNLTFSSANNG